MAKFSRPERDIIKRLCQLEHYDAVDVQEIAGDMPVEVCIRHLRRISRQGGLKCEDTLNDGPAFLVVPEIDDLAELVREQEAEERQPRDRVQQFTEWARRNPASSTAIIIYVVTAPLVGLVGGILGILAFLRQAG